MGGIPGGQARWSSTAWLHPVVGQGPHRPRPHIKRPIPSALSVSYPGPLHCRAWALHQTHSSFLTSACPITLPCRAWTRRATRSCTTWRPPSTSLCSRASRLVLLCLLRSVVVRIIFVWKPPSTSPWSQASRCVFCALGVCPPWVYRWWMRCWACGRRCVCACCTAALPNCCLPRPPLSHHSRYFTGRPPQPHHQRPGLRAQAGGHPRVQGVPGAGGVGFLVGNSQFVGSCSRLTGQLSLYQQLSSAEGRRPPPSANTYHKQLGNGCPYDGWGILNCVGLRA